MGEKTAGQIMFEAFAAQVWNPHYVVTPSEPPEVVNARLNAHREGRVFFNPPAGEVVSLSIGGSTKKLDPPVKLEPGDRIKVELNGVLAGDGLVRAAEPIALRSWAEQDQVTRDAWERAASQFLNEINIDSYIVRETT